MPTEPGIGLFVVPVAVVTGCCVAVAVWHRLVERRRVGPVGTVVLAGCAGALGYGLPMLAWIAGTDQLASLPAAVVRGTPRTLLLLGVLSVGLATGRGAWAAGAGYVVSVGVIGLAGIVYVPFSVLCLCLVGVGFLVEDQVL